MRVKSYIVAVTGALLALTALVADAWAQRRPDFDRRRGELVLLGEKAVGFLVDRDVIRVGQSEDWYRERAFTALRFQAERNDIHMVSIRVVYINGYAEDFRVDQLIRQGADLRVDLRGDRSYIRQIEMVYRSRPNFRGQAHLRVFGEPARRPGPGPGPGAKWDELGCQSVSFIGKDRDVIRVGRRDGRFRAIRLRVRGTDVEFLDVRVVYGNGDPDSIPVRRVVKAGDDTGPLDLKGRDRFIERIELVYRSRPNLRGTATVCADGRD